MSTPRQRLRGALLAAGLSAGLLGTAGSVRASEVEPLYEPPRPGTYVLPVIDTVREHRLLDSDGEPAGLLELAPEQCALVSFVYRSCHEADGCPLAIARLRGIDRDLAELPELAGRVRLVTASFDPDHDTPERMADLRRQLAPRGDWRFLTARDRASLTPVLDDYGQNVRPVLGPDGRETEALRHVLKVFLVDARGQVRNVYSSGLLDPRLILADVRTLLAADPYTLGTSREE